MRGSVRRSVPVVGARSYHDTIIDHYEVSQWGSVSSRAAGGVAAIATMA